jgi:hypothetical protein
MGGKLLPLADMTQALHRLDADEADTWAWEVEPPRDSWVDDVHCPSDGDLERAGHSLDHAAVEHHADHFDLDEDCCACSTSQAPDTPGA